MNQPSQHDPAYFSLLPDSADFTGIFQERQRRNTTLVTPKMAAYADAVEAIPNVPDSYLCNQDGVVQFKSHSVLTAEQKQAIEVALKTFIPWKKGPFNIFGTAIDAEWRSDLKWQRLEPSLGRLTGQTICDIGSHNGYFMFRMLDHQPKCIIGLEPFAKLHFAFDMLKSWIPQQPVWQEMLGVENIDLFEKCFDTIFCLGILYHHTDPVGILRKIRKALKANGRLILDCQGIPGEDSSALVPKNRYCGARGIWFLPTQSCLHNWVKRSGFQSVSTIFAEPLSTNEQRPTAWAPIKSLANFLHPQQPNLTIEGYPAPWRFYCLVS